jgi:hypothetical protein
MSEGLLLLTYFITVYSRLFYKSALVSNKQVFTEEFSKFFQNSPLMS